MCYLHEKIFLYVWVLARQIPINTTRNDCNSISCSVATRNHFIADAKKAKTQHMVTVAPLVAPVFSQTQQKDAFIALGLAYIPLWPHVTQVCSSSGHCCPSGCSKSPRSSFYKCQLAPMPETRNIHWNAHIHRGHGEDVHRQAIQRKGEKLKEMEEKFCKR